MRFRYPCLLLWPALLCGSAAPAAVHQVLVANDFFDPPLLTIQEGDSVHWTNTGLGIHTVTSGEGCVPDELFDSGPLGVSGAFGWRFMNVGEFPYYCTPHCSTGMTGHVTVQKDTPVEEQTWGRIRSLYR